jgi:type I restriction enzyme S subunit
MTELSEWRRVRLGDVLEAKYGKALPATKRRRGAVPVYGSNGIIGWHNRALTLGPTIIVGRKGSLGEVEFSPAPCWAIDTTYFIDDPGPFEFKFLQYLLESLGLTELDQSTAVPGLSRDQLYDIEVPVPTSHEQARLVALIEACRGHATSATDRLAASRRVMERLRQAVLAAACSGRLTADWRSEERSKVASDEISQKRASDGLRPGKRQEEVTPNVKELPDIPEEWRWVALPKLGELGRGKSKHRPRNDPILFGGKYPFIQTGDVARSDGRILIHSQTYNDVGLAQSRLWPARTVCITIAANIAESALLTYPACFPDSVVGLIADESIALPEYVELFIRTAKRDLAAFAPATAQANINLAILSDLAVPLPAINEQQEIVRRVEEALTLGDSVMSRIQTASLRIDGSSQAALTKAFRGELLGSSK